MTVHFPIALLLVAAITGGLAAVMAKHPSWESWVVLQHHAIWGGALAFAGAASVAGWHLAAGQEMSRRARWIAWSMLGITCGVTTFAAHLGANGWCLSTA